MLKLTAVRAEQTKERIASARRCWKRCRSFPALPVSILDTKEQLDLKSMRDFFTARVLGQDEAVAAVVDRIAMLKAGLNDPDKPIGVFLFAGPTGTGKTELAKAVSEFLFGSVDRMIRLDMSEFQTHESMSKILGQSSAAAMEADSLISRVRKQPFSVVLLDEFEKSHPDDLGPVPAGVRRGQVDRRDGPDRGLAPLPDHPDVEPRRHRPSQPWARLRAAGGRVQQGAGAARDQPDLSAGIPEPARQGHRVPSAHARADARHS